jgi:isopentenyldiphosphate isomerase
MRVARWSLKRRHQYLRMAAVGTFPSPGFSLAGPFLIRLDHGEQVDAKMQQCSFRLISIERLCADGALFRQEDNSNTDTLDSRMSESSFVNRCFLNNATALLRSDLAAECVAAATIASLTATHSSLSGDESVVTICVITDTAVPEDHGSWMIQHQALLAVLAKVLAHHLLISSSSRSGSQQHRFDTMSVVLPDQSTIALHGCQDQTEVPWRLFAAEAAVAGVEMVEMVDQGGAMIGAVPRSLVHRHNLLHRGVGIFVTRGRPIQLVDTILYQPDLYVHRRTATKRIFPSLYDMFVGGVSSTFESPRTTARREVGEELGLLGPVNDDDQALSGPILQCVVCTSYNRCVVDLFCYTVHNPTDEAMIKWQPEEVSWGAFVPYAVVEAAADRSIKRCQPWPGLWPRYQSRRKGHLLLPEEEPSCGQTTTTTRTRQEAWESWDFVPDGLLVWVAWTRFLEGQAA